MKRTISSLVIVLLYIPSFAAHNGKTFQQIERSKQKLKQKRVRAKVKKTNILAELSKEDIRKAFEPLGPKAIKNLVLGYLGEHFVILNLAHAQNNCKLYIRYIKLNDEHKKGSRENSYSPPLFLTFLLSTQEPEKNDNILRQYSFFLRRAETIETILDIDKKTACGTYTRTLEFPPVGKTVPLTKLGFDPQQIAAEGQLPQPVACQNGYYKVAALSADSLKITFGENDPNVKELTKILMSKDAR